MSLRLLIGLKTRRKDRYIGKGALGFIRGLVGLRESLPMPPYSQKAHVHVVDWEPRIPPGVAARAASTYQPPDNLPCLEFCSPRASCINNTLNGDIGEGPRRPAVLAIYKSATKALKLISFIGYIISQSINTSILSTPPSASLTPTFLSIQCLLLSFPPVLSLLSPTPRRSATAMRQLWLHSRHRARTARSVCCRSLLLSRFD